MAVFLCAAFSLQVFSSENPEAGKGEGAADPMLKEARLHFDQGVEFYKEENYSAALAEFLKSYEIVPKYEILYNIAICYMETGRNVRALEQFQKFLDEGGEKIPADLMKDIKEMILKIEGKIGYLEVECSEDGAEMELDEFQEYETPVKKQIPLDPGFHSIVVRKSGFKTFKKEFPIASRERKFLQVALKPVEAALVKKEEIPQAEPVEKIKVKAEKKKVEKGKRLKLWTGAASLGAGGLIGAISIATGKMALNKRNQMRDEIEKCPDTMTREACPEAYRLQDEGRNYMLATNILVGFAAAAGAAGIVLLVLDMFLPEKKSGKKESSSMIFVTGDLVGNSSLPGLKAVLVF